MNVIDLLLAATAASIAVSIYRANTSILYLSSTVRKPESLRSFPLNFHVLIPIYNETDILCCTVKRFMSAFSDRHSTNIYFITHASDSLSTKIIRDLISGSSTQFHHVINHGQSHSKASQLNAAIDAIGRVGGSDIISVYDADSVPDPRAHEFIQRYAAKADLGVVGAFQQSPFYPLSQDLAFIARVGHARAIHSLSYHLCHELPNYLSSVDGNLLRMSVHLTGHGEHITASGLNETGGFLEPSCDSSLGFAISYCGLKIVPIPYPDTAQTPHELGEIWRQGIRWYRGCDLYWREIKRTTDVKFAAVSTFLTLCNNLRWGAVIPVIIITFLGLEMSQVTHSLFIFVIILLILRHIFMLRGYNVLSENAINHDHNAIGLPYWLCEWFIPYALNRVFWSFVPLSYYVLSLTQTRIRHQSTKKFNP